MISRLFHALVASSIVAGTFLAASAAVHFILPQGRTKRLAQQYLLAPGAMVYEKLQGNKSIRQAGKGLDRAEEEAVRLHHVYNVSIATLAGFGLCLAMTLIFGIESIEAAVSLGIKVTLSLIFLHGALILGGVIALRRFKG